MTSAKCPSIFVSDRARLPLNALCAITFFAFVVFASLASAQSSPKYGSLTACNGMTVGSPTYGAYGGELNDFVPFPSTYAWNTSIASAAVDPNSATLISALGPTTELHPTFGASPADGGIPYYVTDSTEVPSVPINVGAYPFYSEVVVAPFPTNDATPIGGDPMDCGAWPNTYIGDDQTLVIDRATCWIYEIFNTQRCNGLWEADSETIWDAVNYNARPWGWTSADAAGESIYAGTLKYSEAASGTVSHAIRFTVENTAGDSNLGYFVLPAIHAASTTTTADLLPEGARLRLRASSITNLSSYSAINQAIIVGLETYGMVVADSGGNLFFIGDTDPNWNDTDLGNLHAITASDFDVIQMTPSYPGMDQVSATTDYPESLPTITTFTANGQSSALTVNPGTEVTFDYTVTGTNYDASYSAETGVPYAYIDNIGPLRLSGTCPCSGSVTITPTATQEYTLYALNAATVNNAVSSTSITVTVTGSVLQPPVFTPPPGTYAGKLLLPVTMSTPSATLSPSGAYNGTFYYTTNGSTPTTASAVYTGTGTSGAAIDMPVSATTTLKAIVAVPGYSGTSAVTSGVYTIGSGSATLTDTPTFTPPAGTYNTIQTVYFQDASSSGNPSTSGSVVYYTITAGTSGTTPVAPTEGSGDPPTAPTLAFNTAGGCYGCVPNAVIVPSATSATTTIEAIAQAQISGWTNSAIATGRYTFVAGTPAFSPQGGSYSSSQTVTISSVTPSASIYYTTNGTTPTTASTHYSGPVTVSTTKTLEALATYPGFNNSAVESAVYTIGATAATPVFSPAAGTYSSAQTVTISDSTSGASIYYTTNGTTPTTSSTKYTSAVTVSATETIEAIATASGYSQSAVGSAAYTISGSSPAYVQECNKSGSSTKSVACTLSGVTAGDALLIGIYNGEGSVSSVTSSTGTPTSIISNYGLLDGGDISAYLLSDTASGSITITAKFSTTNGAPWMGVTEFTHVATSPLDTSADGATAGDVTVEDSANLTTTASDDLLWSLCYGGSSMSVGTAPITWTAEPITVGYGFFEYGLAGSAGTYYGQCTVNSADTNIITVALK